MCAGDACWALGLLAALLTQSGHHLETPSSSTERDKTAKDCLGSTSSGSGAMRVADAGGGWGTGQGTRQRDRRPLSRGLSGGPFRGASGQPCKSPSESPEDSPEKVPRTLWQPGGEDHCHPTLLPLGVQQGGCCYSPHQEGSVSPSSVAATPSSGQSPFVPYSQNSGGRTLRKAVPSGMSGTASSLSPISAVTTRSFGQPPFTTLLARSGRSWMKVVRVGLLGCWGQCLCHLQRCACVRRRCHPPAEERLWRRGCPRSGTPMGSSGAAGVVTAAGEANKATTTPGRCQVSWAWFCHSPNLPFRLCRGSAEPGQAGGDWWWRRCPQWLPLPRRSFWALLGRVWSTGGLAPNAAPRGSGGRRASRDAQHHHHRHHVLSPAVGHGGAAPRSGEAARHCGGGAPHLPWGLRGPWHPLPDGGLGQLVGDSVDLGRLIGHQQPRDRGQHAGSDR